MSAPTRRAITSVRHHVRSMGALAQPVKEQPWKSFWPLNAAKYSAEEKEKMPWLTWKFNPDKPTDRPWRKWMLENQTTVVRRGAW